jgi:transposase
VPGARRTASQPEGSDYR